MILIIKIQTENLKNLSITAVYTKVIEALCIRLNCQPSDIMEVIPNTWDNTDRSCEILKCKREEWKKFNCRDIYMDNLKYAMEKSYTYMVKEINSILSGSMYSVEERQRLFYSCGICLHWILDYAERLDIIEEDKKIISAFKFANNALKHDKTLLEITTQTGGFSFPITFPLCIPEKKVCWKNIDDNGKFKNQYENYIQYLKGKDVIITCKNIIETLEKYNDIKG